MMKRKTYTPPKCVCTRVVLEQGLCQTSGQTVGDVTIQSSEPIQVKEYTSIGDDDGFKDVGFQ